MNETVSVLIEQVIVMFILMAVGYLLFKSDKINSNGASQLSFIVLYICSPVLVLESMMVPFEKEKLVYGAWIFVITIALTIISILIVRILFKNKSGVEKFAMIFSNSGFLGIPLIRHVLGNEAVFYVSIYNLVICVFMWTYGVYLVSRDFKEASFKKIIFNPSIIAIFIGLFIFISGYQLPKIFVDACDQVANMNTGMVMIVLGVYLAEANLIKEVSNKKTWIVSITRLIIIPICMIPFLKICPVNNMVKTVLLIAACTPCSGSTPMFCQKYGNNYQFAAGLVGISTLLSLATMPLCVQLLSIL